MAETTGEKAKQVTTRVTTTSTTKTAMKTTRVTTTAAEKESEPPIDAVITWVNGSDPDFVKELNKYKAVKDGVDVRENRFADFVRGFLLIAYTIF